MVLIPKIINQINKPKLIKFKIIRKPIGASLNIISIFVRLLIFRILLISKKWLKIHKKTEWFQINLIITAKNTIMSKELIENYQKSLLW